MGGYAIVTDSTCNLGDEVVAANGLDMIPLNVHWGDDTYKDGVTLSAARFYEMLPQRSAFPKTSQPSAGEFIEFFQDVAERKQVNTILAIHISSDLSGTVASAMQAKSALSETRPDLRIEVVDSRSVSLGLGVQVLVAARALAAGKSLEETMALREQCYDSLDVVFAVDTLEYLHRGGRIGGAARLLGSALRMKPVLEVREGRIESVEKVRSRKKSLRRLIEIAGERWEGRTPTEVAIMQAEVDEELPAFTRALEEKLGCAVSITQPLSPVVGTHGGPGTIGIVVYALDEVL